MLSEVIKWNVSREGENKCGRGRHVPTLAWAQGLVSAAQIVLICVISGDRET